MVTYRGDDDESHIADSAANQTLNAGPYRWEGVDLGAIDSVLATGTDSGATDCSLHLRAGIVRHPMMPV